MKIKMKFIDPDAYAESEVKEQMLDVLHQTQAQGYEQALFDEEEKLSNVMDKHGISDEITVEFDTDTGTCEIIQGDIK